MVSLLIFLRYSNEPAKTLLRLFIRVGETNGREFDESYWFNNVIVLVSFDVGGLWWGIGIRRYVIGERQ